jgi:nicotinate-nucleotide--dimethylbenzimidazole phosphoribosyltransferase
MNTPSAAAGSAPPASTMHSDRRTMIVPTAKPALEQALRLKLSRRRPVTGSLGELEPLAVRLGLIQDSLRPRLRQPQLLLFAGDHGLAVDVGTPGARSTAQEVDNILSGRVPVAPFSHLQGLTLNVVDCGLAEPVPQRPGLMARKIAHGTRNCRVVQAMTVDQVHAAIRAGMEIADTLPGNVMACAGVGVGSHEVAALVISRITSLAVRDMISPDAAGMPTEPLARALVVLQGAQTRHANVVDPVEVLAAFGGFETAMMVGAMLVAATKRHLIMVDGMTACAALVVASRIAAPVTDYCVFCRSHGHKGLDVVLSAFQATALLELGMSSIDGTGVTLAWPLVHSAAALLTEVAESQDDPAAEGPDSRHSGPPSVPPSGSSKP